jgi:hypothetical protein
MTSLTTSVESENRLGNINYASNKHCTFNFYGCCNENGRDMCMLCVLGTGCIVGHYDYHNNAVLGTTVYTILGIQVSLYSNYAQ